MTDRIDRARLLGAWPALLVLCACAVAQASNDPFSGADASERDEFRLHVENDNFYDARIYTIVNGVRRPIGYVGGHSRQVFTVPWSFSNDLRVQIDLLAGPTCTTEVIPVDPGDELLLQIVGNANDASFCRY